MSEYDRCAAQSGYEITQMHIERALQRMSALEINCAAVKSSGVAAIPRPSPQHMVNPFRYQTYDLGYNQGDQRVSLPSAQANPPPLHNQVVHTSIHVYENAFLGTDLHPILFRLEPFKDEYRSIKVPILYDASTGQPVITSRGETLRYFSFLPRYISWHVTGALLELWFRLDYRLEMNDILMRIEDGPCWNSNNMKAARNAQQMKRSRFRDRLCMPAWASSRQHPVKADVDFVGKLSSVQICLNTTMVVDILNGKLLKPIFKDLHCNQQLGFMDSGLSLDYFLGNLATTVPSKRMIATLALRHRLQELAIVRSLGDSAEAWRHLERADEPRWWNDKQSDYDLEEERRFDELDGYGTGKTHREWIELEFGNDMKVCVTKRAQTRNHAIYGSKF